MNITIDEIVAIASLVGAIGSAIIFLWRFFKVTRVWFKDQKEIKNSILEIKSEVSYNGGGSIKDMVLKLSNTCDRMEVRQTVIDQRSKIALHYQDRCLFETDREGNLIWANENFYQQTVGQGDISGGLDWVTVVDDEERGNFLDELSSCLMMSRRIDIETVSVDKRKLRFIGHPYRLDDGQHEGFLIHIKIQE
jgi:hypothetical protein